MEDDRRFSDEDSGTTGRYFSSNHILDCRPPLPTLPDTPEARRAKFLKPEDTESPIICEEDQISIQLTGDDRLKYLAVGVDVRRRFILGMRKTWRWQGTPQIIDPSFHENDLGHVTELVMWCNEVKENYPQLYQELCVDEKNWQELLTMVIIHDIGEIGREDVALPNQTSEEGMKSKRIEPRWARYLLYKSFPEPESTSMISIYNRFEEPSDTDKLGLFARAIDKAQAAANVARHIIPYSVECEGYDYKQEFFEAQSFTLRLVGRLMQLLKHSEAKIQLSQFINEKLVSEFDKLDLPLIEELRETVRKSFPEVFEIE